MLDPSRTLRQVDKAALLANQPCMRERRLGTALLLGAFLCASAQQLRKPIRRSWTARVRYYSLQANGFVSLACTVQFDAATVPLLPRLEVPAQDRVRRFFGRDVDVVATPSA